MESDGTRVLSFPAGGEEPWLASRLLRRQVVNAATLDPVGRVSDVLFEPLRCRLAALRVTRSTPPGGLTGAARQLLRGRGGGLIGLEHIISLNGDVVVVDTNPTASPAAFQRDGVCRLSEVCDLTIITLHGLCLGTLVDVLLEPAGSVVASYFVEPTRQAEAFLPPFDGSTDTSPRPQEDGAEAARDAIAPSTAHLRVIPASPRVHIGDSLIMVVDDTEPLWKESYVVAAQMEA
jgi:sporulation protein YlmC with PRC-barrel domain